MNQTIIRKKSGINLDLGDLWSYRDLLLVLAYRDLRVRYAQTLIGFFWALIQPVATLLIFALVFNRVVEVDTGGVPYLLFAICGLSAWTYFSFVVSQAGSSLIGAQDMIKKIYFPRLIIPISKAAVGLVDYLIVILILFALFIIYGFKPSMNIIFLPLYLIMTIVSALSIGIWISALTVRYRDFQHVVPFIIQFGLYISPIGFPSKLIVERLPEWFAIIYYLNPVAGLVDGIRWSILGGEMYSDLSYISFGTMVILFISGLFYFKSVERVMADII